MSNEFSDVLAVFEPESGLFAVYVDDQRANLRLIEARRESEAHQIARFVGDGLEVEHHLFSPRYSGLVEQWQVIRVTGDQPITLTRIDSLAMKLLPREYELLHFTSDWGQEFEPVRTPLTGEIILETRAGRSSKGMHPWLALMMPGGFPLAVSVAWSGNWIFALSRWRRAVITSAAG